MDDTQHPIDDPGDGAEAGLEALKEADPADAAAIAEDLADTLTTELDHGEDGTLDPAVPVSEDRT